MNKRILSALCVVLSFAGCVKEISSDERLERETARSEALQSSTAEDLAKLSCDDLQNELLKARDESAAEEKRLATYTDLFDKAKDRTSRFDEALTRNPDLAYTEGSERIIASRDGCVQAAADVRLDFEGLVREILQLPVVDEFREGRAVKVARLNFDTLREAIEKLALDDKDALFTRLSNAEKTVEVKSSGGKRK